MTTTLVCRTATTFSADKRLDEHALAEFLERFVPAGLGVYVASGGSGEWNALTDEEPRRVYEVAVEGCKGKVAVNANPPEKHSAKQTDAYFFRLPDAGATGRLRSPYQLPEPAEVDRFAQGLFALDIPELNR